MVLWPAAVFTHIVFQLVMMSLKERVIADLKAMAIATVIRANVGDSIIYMGDNKSN